jgi:DNA-directed RNA polymerase specialized sigma24 family protein
MTDTALATLNQSEHYRAAARALRALISSMRHSETRTQLVSLAVHYEGLAAGAATAEKSPAASAPECTRGTLGRLLYADNAKSRVSEKSWVALVRSIAMGDQRALHVLYERTHRVVFTLIMRITNNRQVAEELTLDTFHDVWQRATTHDVSGESVVGWIMNRARSRASERSLVERRKKRFNHQADNPSQLTAAGDSGDTRDLMTDVLRPAQSLWLWVRLAHRTAAKGGGGPLLPATRQMSEPEWEEVAAGISCKLLATDTERERVSMLVRLAPGVDYPPHIHAGVEELHLLHGELWINDRKLYPGDYNRAGPGTFDKRVCSETGCTCVLITSTRDVIH